MRNQLTGRKSLDDIPKRTTKATLISVISQSIVFLSCVLISFCAVAAYCVRYLGYMDLPEQYRNPANDNRSILEKNWAKLASAAISVGLISVAGVLYKMLAARLTDWENHKTHTDHLDALISKIVLFEFVNNYFALFYIAFFVHIPISMTSFGRSFAQWLPVSDCSRPQPPGDLDEGSPTSCMAEMQVQLFVVSTFKTIGKKFVELCKPFIVAMLKPYLKSCCKKKSLVKSSSVANTSDGIQRKDNAVPATAITRDRTVAPETQARDTAWFVILIS
eukprot:SAG31_NODE_2713_length_5205_cov_2.328241_3_plen_276_part_00